MCFSTQCSAAHCLTIMFCRFSLQILTKAGLLDVPAWYVAGKVANDQSGIDYREFLMKKVLIASMCSASSNLSGRLPNSASPSGRPACP